MGTESKVTITLLIKDQFTKGVQSAGRALDKFTKGVVREAIQWGSRLATVFAGAVVAGFGLAVKQAADFEQRMNEVGTLLSGNVTEQVNSLSEAVLNLSESMPKSADDLGAGLYQVLSAGVTDTADAMDVLNVSAKAAVGGLTSTFTSVDALTTLINAYGLSAKDATHLSDVMFQTVKDGKVTFEQLASQIGDVASTASLSGVSVEELGAAIATITQAGVSPAEAVTSLNRLLLSIIDPTDEAGAAARRLGLDWSVAGLQANGLAGMMDQLNRVAGGNIDALLRVVPEIRAFRAAAVLGGTGANTFRRELENMSHVAGVSQQAFNQMNNGANATFATLKNKFNVELIRAGREILPGLRESVEGTNGPLEMLRKLTDENSDSLKEMGRNFGTLVSSGLNLLLFLAEVASALGNIIRLWRLWKDPGLMTVEPELRAIRSITDANALYARMNQYLRERATIQDQLLTARQALADAEAHPLRDANGVQFETVQHAQAMLDLKDKVEELENTYNGLGVAMDAARDRMQTLGQTAEGANLRVTSSLDTAAEAAARLQTAYAQRQVDLNAITDLERQLQEEMTATGRSDSARSVILRRSLTAMRIEYEKWGLEIEAVTAKLDVLRRKEAAAAAGPTVKRSAGGNAPDPVGDNLRRIQEVQAQIAAGERAVALARNDNERIAAENELWRIRTAGVQQLHEQADVVAGLNVSEALRLQMYEDLAKVLRGIPRDTRMADLERDLSAIGLRLEDIGNASKTSARDFHDAWSEAVGDITSRFANDFGDAISTAFKAMVEGSKSGADAFKAAMLGALAAVARGFGEFFMAQAVASLASFLSGKNPAGLRAAGFSTAAATAMFALAGTLEGIVAASGGGGGGGGPAAQADLAEKGKGEAILIIEGGFLDMNDPRQEQQLARALEELSGRRVTVRSGSN